MLECLPIIIIIIIIIASQYIQKLKTEVEDECAHGTREIWEIYILRVSQIKLAAQTKS